MPHKCDQNKLLATPQYEVKRCGTTDKEERTPNRYQKKKNFKNGGKSRITLKKTKNRRTKKIISQVCTKKKKFPPKTYPPYSRVKLNFFNYKP